MEIKSTSSQKIRYKDYGILILRVGIGLTLFLQCINVYLGKTASLQTLQHNNSSGVDVMKMLLLGLITISALLFIIGYFTRFISAFLSLAFFLTFLFQVISASPFDQVSYDLNMSIVFFASIFLGSGKLSVDYKTNHYKISLENSTAI